MMRVEKVDKVRWIWPWPKKVKPVVQSKKTDNKKTEKEVSTAIDNEIA